MNSEARKRAQATPQPVGVSLTTDPAGQRAVLLQLPHGWLTMYADDARTVGMMLVSAADELDDLTVDLVEEGRRLASEREDLIAQGVDPADLLVPEVPVEVQPCPECRAGKHANCGSWDYVADEPAACPCALEGHEGGA